MVSGRQARLATSSNEAPELRDNLIWRLLFPVASIEWAILLGTLAYSLFFTATPVADVLPAPHWLNLWVAATTRSTLIALPIALAVHMLIRWALSRVRLGAFLEILIYSFVGLFAGVVLWVLGWIIQLDLAMLALLTSCVGLWIGLVGRSTLLVFTAHRTIGRVLAPLALIVAAAALLAGLLLGA